jgi:hypothetical protein
LGIGYASRNASRWAAQGNQSNASPAIMGQSPNLGAMVAEPISLNPPGWNAQIGGACGFDFWGCCYDVGFNDEQPTLTETKKRLSTLQIHAAAQHTISAGLFYRRPAKQTCIPELSDEWPEATRVACWVPNASVFDSVLVRKRNQFVLPNPRHETGSRLFRQATVSRHTL